MWKQLTCLLATAIASLILLSACQAKEEHSDLKELTEFGAAYAAAWSGQDPIVFASFYAENGSFRINDGEPSIGRDAIAETARSFMASFPDMVVRLVELRHTKDHVEFHWHWTGTNTGPEGTGNAVNLTGYEHWVLNSDGLILESHGYMDDAEYQRQLNADRTVNLMTMNWIHGAQDCDSAQSATDYLEWQQVQYQKDTYIFRQNKCSNYEAPFVYLFVGAERALLIDSGATVGGGSSLVTQIREITNLPVIAAHSHGHGDHRSGDASLQSSVGFTVVGTGPDAVQGFFKFADWPLNPVTLELGNRSIALLPIPGHHNDDLAFYDSRSKFVVTGDTLYPGRLYIGDWSAYRASISRLMRWVEAKEVAYVMGTHIEMSSTPNVDYPIGTTYQPDELALPLSVSDIAKLEAKTTLMETPTRTYLGNFIIWPKD